MRRSRFGRNRIGRVVATAGAALIAGTGLAGAQDPHAAHASGVIQVLSANVQGKNVFIPATIAVVEDEPHTLSVFNSTDTPHGFKIEAAKVETILQPGVETVVELPAMKSGIYPVTCHLHPPHRGGQLVVLDDD
jgi:heme/copper-type cytochrome/quinol oxidase subunit 2